MFIHARFFRLKRMCEKEVKRMPDRLEKVIHYYQATERDYKRFWTGPGEFAAMHFGYYDAATRNHAGALVKMNEILAAFAPISSGDTVFDAGCGYGGSAFWLANHIGCRVVGVTPVPEQVHEARASAERQGIGEQATFEVMDYCHTSLPDASFDVVWALESLVHTEQKQDFLREAARLLRPGGRLVIAEYMLREQPPLNEDERTMLVPWLSGWAMAGLYTVGEYVQDLSNCGFHHIQTRDITEQVRPSINHLGKLRVPTLPTASLFAWIARGLCACGGYSKSRLHNIEAGICQNKALRLGLWHYMLLRAEKR